MIVFVRMRERGECLVVIINKGRPVCDNKKTRKMNKIVAGKELQRMEGNLHSSFPLVLIKIEAGKGRSKECMRGHGVIIVNSLTHSMR